MKYRSLKCPIVSPGLVLILYIHGITARNGFPPGLNRNQKIQQLQERIITAREVEKIKLKILRTLGMRNDIPKTTQNTPVVNNNEQVTSPVYKRTEVRVYRSEIPKNHTDQHIIEFNLTKVQLGKGTEMSSVNLFIRVKYSRNKNSKRNREKRSLPSTKEGKTSERAQRNKAKRLLRKEQRKAERERLRKLKKRRKKRFIIGLVISNVTSEGKPDQTLAAVNSTLKRTKDFNVALPIDKINQSIRTNNTLQLYVQCVGCGRKASLILIHKSKKRKRVKNKHKDLLRNIHKRRPRLLIESHVTNSAVKT